MTIEKKSLITKINSIIHRLIWIIILLCGSFFIGFNSYETWKNRSHEVNLLSNVLADAMIDPLIFDRKSEGAARLKKFLDIPYIDNVCLYYSFGSLFLDYHKSNSLRCPDDINLVRSHFSDLPFSNLASIDKAGSNVGYVFIGANSHDIKAIITTNAFIILGFILATLGLGTLISRKLEHIILSPLISLKSVVTHITQENDCSHRVNIETDDEIGDLAMAFNRMLDIISEGDAALRDLNLALEDKVHERTEDLEYALKVKEDFLSNMSHEIRTPSME
ncbi:MAG: HAMP domain-containing protein [Alphaproteobacteria bacterium]|nr:HAMP domain-containing protein [Alphaproteobacteria bacterium]